MLEALIKRLEGYEAMLTANTYLSHSDLERALSREEFFAYLEAAKKSSKPHHVFHTPYYDYAQLSDTLWVKAVSKEGVFERINLLKQPENTERWRLKVAYDGTLFEGFQRQNKTVRTVQGELESALSHLHPEKISLHPASRTDKGVHAKAQYVHFDTTKSHPVQDYPSLMNRLLPRDIRILEALKVPNVFHARYDVQEKTYRYRLATSVSLEQVHHVYETDHPSSACLNERLAVFVGTHDFANFAKLKGAHTTLKTITRAQASVDHNDVIIEIQGKGFVRYMVRMMVGAVLKYDAKTIAHALNHPQEALGKHLAPAHGLTLYEIDYGQVTTPR